jgi:PAS domain S-box-containing protein
MPELSGFSFSYAGDYLKAALLVSLMSVWVLVALFFYLNHYTKRRYFTIWAAAWLFYALWLTLSLRYDPLEAVPDLVVLMRLWCVNAVALFLIWGSARFLGQRGSQRLFGLFMLFLFTWSYVGTYHMDSRLQCELPIFSLIGLASLRISWCFFGYRQKRRYIGAGLLSFGFLLWGLHHIAHPFLQTSEDFIGMGYFISAVLQLFIAVSMIVLVLEEARAVHQQAFQQISTHRAERDVMQSRVKSTEERFRTLFEQASEAIIITTLDNDLRILELNAAARRLLGLGSDPALDLSLKRFIALGERQQTALRSSAEWVDYICHHRPLNLVQKNGAIVPIESAGAPVSYADSPAQQFFLHELTERAHLEQQLRQAEKLSALGQMISGVAHELNNPMAVIKGYLEVILAHHNLRPETRADLEKVAQESERAAKLVKNFLAFAREKPSPQEMVGLNEIVRRVVELRKFAITLAGVELVLELDKNLPNTQAAPDQIQQVFVVLLNNALQAMVEAPLPHRLVLRTQVREQVVQATVEDNGPGIPPHLENRIFEPFFTTKQVGNGTGLGLSIAHSIVTDHRGRIYHQRPPQGGARFVVELPIISATNTPTGDGETAAQVTASKKPDSQPPNSPVKAAQVLVVDDERLIGDLLGEIVDILGHKPTICISAMEALDLLAEQDFDVIFSDIRMPVMDGQRFYREVSQLKPSLSRRIIFLTGDLVNEETRSFLTSTGNIYLAKPFQLSNVQDALLQVLREHPSDGTIPA